MNDKLVVFLYLLVCDELATGVIERLLKEVERSDALAVFSAPYIESQARAWAVRLR